MDNQVHIHSIIIVNESCLSLSDTIYAMVYCEIVSHPEKGSSLCGLHLSFASRFYVTIFKSAPNCDVRMFRVSRSNATIELSFSRRTHRFI